MGTCNKCGKTVEWRILSEGNRPFDSDGTPHFDTCREGQAKEWGASKKKEKKAGGKRK